MRLENIVLKHFRNYEFQEVIFNSKINVFSGANGQGKTNLLESIYYLAVARSFRTNQEQELVGWGANSFFIRGKFNSNKKPSSVEIGYIENQSHQIKIDGSIIKRSEYICLNPVVIFSPDDLLLIKEGPALRRRFLNMEGSRLKPLYYNKLRSYHRIVQQRNHLLKEARFNIYNPEIMEPWNHSLITIGSALIRMRLALLRKLEQQAQLFFEELTGLTETISLNYVCSFDFKNENELEENFKEKLKADKQLEQKRGYTTVGPHRDDFLVRINGYEAKKYASQGQQRSAVLALKMGEVEMFHLSNGESPIVLLDDVFSEFDQTRRRQLLHFLLQREGQSFITSAAPLAQLLKGLDDKSKIFSVEKGKINIEGSENTS